jgi:hypothetical protein
MNRDTLRKRIVSTVVAERRAVLLDELRWEALRREAKAQGKKLKAISVSQASSFARTVRDHMPELRTWDVSLSDGPRPSALIAATAVFRLKQHSKLEAFLGGPSPTVTCRFVTDLPVHEFGETPRYRRSNFAVPYYHLYLVDLHSGAEHIARIKIPPSHKVTIVGVDHELDVERALSSARWRVITED